MCANEGAVRNDFRYRAILDTIDELPAITIQQEIKDDWYLTPGSWYLGTLTDELHDYRDSIVIDGGSRWLVTEGMKAAIDEALALCDGLEAVQKAYKAVFTC